MFKDMYKILVKDEQMSKFQGIAINEAGEVSIEPQVMYQSFFTKEDAEELCSNLREVEFETKIVRGR